MNKPAVEKNPITPRPPQTMRFGAKEIRPGMIFFVLGAILLIVCVAVYRLDNIHSAARYPHLTAGRHLKAPPLIKPAHGETDILIEKLKQLGLWKINSAQKVPRFFIKKFPPDLSALDDISLKKRVFLHSLLPQALYVREETLLKRRRLQIILTKINCPVKAIDFDFESEENNQCAWPDFLTDDEVDFVRDLSTAYRTSSAEILLQRVDAVPTSIMLAQGALESSWGGSRFTREGNNIFGMWTWGKKGIVPLRREEGKTHKVKTYESILDAVKAYHLTLNHLAPYKKFREFRKFSNDPLLMAEGLLEYSERGIEYVEEIKSVIQNNDLRKYDSYQLSDTNPQKLTGSVTRSDPTAKNRSTSL